MNVLTNVFTPCDDSYMTTKGGPAAPEAQEADMFTSLTAARKAAAAFFAADPRAVAVYYTVAGREVRISREELA